MIFNSVNTQQSYFEGDGPGGNLVTLVVEHSINDPRLVFINPLNGENAGFWPTGPSFDNIERIQFTDSSLALDINGDAGMAYRIYKAAFDRDPMTNDTQGLGFWIHQMDEGMDLLEVSARFIDSQEFRTAYGDDVSNETFLTALYRNVLDRDPDQGGLQWWIEEMANNPDKTPAKVLADFSESAENMSNVAQLIAQGIVYDPWLGS